MPDFHLQTGSPAINLGIDVSPYGIFDDYEGAPRPAGAYDAGAYEYGFFVPLSALLPGVTFNAFPSSILLGATSHLSWNVTSATTISLFGYGGVGASSSLNVSPVSSITYFLTAANNEGSVTRNQTVTVINPNTGDVIGGVTVTAADGSIARSGPITLKLAFGNHTTLLAGLTFSGENEIEVVEGYLSCISLTLEIMSLLKRSVPNEDSIYTTANENLTTGLTLSLVMQASTIDTINYREGRYAGLKNVTVELINE